MENWSLVRRGLSVVVILFVLVSVGRGTDETVELKYGGPFELIDHNGRTVTDRDFLGQYLLIYFGYTYCPDVCPTSLVRMTQAMKRMGDQANVIQPVFISVDAKRDTPERLAPYVKAFHPRLVGLTGDKFAIRTAARAYRVIYRAGTFGGEYRVGHTDYVYLVGRDGNFIEKISGRTSSEDLAAKLIDHLEHAAEPSTP